MADATDIAKAKDLCKKHGFDAVAAVARAKEFAKRMGIDLAVAQALVVKESIMTLWVKDWTKQYVIAMLRLNAKQPHTELKKEVEDLRNRIKVLERYIVGDDEQRSVGIVQSAQLEQLITLVKQPVVPVKDAKGVIIGAQRVERLDG